MANHTVEVSSKGKWYQVPAVPVDGHNLLVKGKWIRMAVVHDEEWLETEITRPALCLRTLKAERSQELRADIFTFAQKPTTTLPRFDYPIEWESVAAACTSSYKDWWEKLPQESRKNVRRSQKRGVVVQVRSLTDELVEGIIGVNNDSPMRQNLPFAHYGKTFAQVKKDQSAFLDRSDFICAYLGDELIGFLKIIYRGDVASILQLLPKASHADKRPANVLVAKAVELCAAKGIAVLTYGLFNYGNKRDNPLREFKVRNGFDERLIPRYYVPVTLWGALCVRTKVYRGLHGLLPHRVIMAVVNARAKWYQFRGPGRRCSSTPEQPNRNRQMERSNPPAGSTLNYPPLAGSDKPAQESMAQPALRQS